MFSSYEAIKRRREIEYGSTEDDSPAAKRARIAAGGGDARYRSVRAAVPTPKIGGFTHGVTANNPTGVGGIVGSSTSALLSSTTTPGVPPNMRAPADGGSNYSGAPRSNQPVVIPVMVRPLRMPGTAGLVSPKFKDGDTVWFAHPDRDREAHAHGSRSMGTLVSLYSTAQIRAMEGNHRHFLGSTMTFAQAGLKQRADGGVDAVFPDETKVELNKADVTSYERPGMFDRYQLAGVVQSTFVSDSTPMVGLGVAGPMLVNNIWGDVRVGMDLFFREMTIQTAPELGDDSEKTLSKKKDAVKTVVPWPTQDVLQDYYNGLDAEEEANSRFGSYNVGGTQTVDVEHVGPRVLLTTSSQKFTGGSYGADVRIFGTVLAVYPTGTSSNEHVPSPFGGSGQEELLALDSLVDPRAETTHYGKILVDVAAGCGMNVYEAALSLEGLLVRDDDDDDDE